MRGGASVLGVAKPGKGLSSHKEHRSPRCRIRRSQVLGEHCLWRNVGQAGHIFMTWRQGENSFLQPCGLTSAQESCRAQGTGVFPDLTLQWLLSPPLASPDSMAGSREELLTSRVHAASEHRPFSKCKEQGAVQTAWPGLGSQSSPLFCPVSITPAPIL